MKTFQIKSSNITIVFLLTLFFLFAFSSVSLLLLGSEVYQKTASSMEKHYEERSVSSYLIEKIRQNDSNGQINTFYLEDTPVLGLSQTINNVSYTTYLYVYENHLYELFARSDFDFTLADGQEIMPLSSLEICFCNQQMLEITYTDTSDKTQTIWVSTHTRQNTK